MPSQLLRSRTLVSCLSLVFLCAPIALGQIGNANRSSITGFVFDADRRPIGQVIVELQSEFSTIGRARTDGSGRFSFYGLAHGRYTIRVLPLGTGYMEATQEVELAGFGMRGQSLADHQQKDFYLRPRKTSDSGALRNEVVFAQEVPKEAESAYKSANTDLEDNRVKEATASLEKAISIFPKYFAALLKLGKVKANLTEYNEAIPFLEQALAVNSRCFDCYYLISFSNYSLGRFEPAAAAGEKAIIETQSSVEANLLLGMSYRMLKLYDKAETALKQANKAADGETADVHWQLALLYGKDLKKYAEAAKALEAFLKLSPDAPNKEDIKKLIKQFKDQAKNNS